VTGPPGTRTTFYGIDIDITAADLRGVDLAECWLSRSRLTGTNLRDCSLVRAHCEETDFSGADLSNADLSRASGPRARFRYARLRGADLTATRFHYADFTGADLAGANLGDAVFTGSTFAGANLTTATAGRTGLREAILDLADVAALTGTVTGPVSVLVDGKRALLDWADLELWFAIRGARVTRFPTGEAR
jgi:uncharacterized protein YjbI with pentapeptide repeats